jgi:hypothetical protein
MVAVKGDAVATHMKVQLGKHIELKERLPGVYQVFAPFYFTDGDMIDLFLRVEGDKIRIMDMGVTLMHVSYDLDLSTGTRREQLFHILGQMRIQEDDGNLFTDAPMNRLYPNLMHMYMAMARVSAMDLTKSDRVRSHFADDFRSFMVEHLADLSPKTNAFLESDNRKEYPIDLLIEIPGRRPVMIFPVSNESQAKNAVIVLQHFAETAKPWGMAIYEDMQTVAKKEVAWLTNVADKQYASFSDNQERIVSYVRDLAAA